MNAVRENKGLRSKKDLGCEAERKKCLMCRRVKPDTSKRIQDPEVNKASTCRYGDSNTCDPSLAEVSGIHSTFLMSSDQLFCSCVLFYIWSD